jgi:integrase
VSVYKRGGIWWYKFRFAGNLICESSKSNSKTIAWDAQRNRRRELELTYNRIEKRAMPPNFSRAAQSWLDKITVSAATKETYKFALEHLKESFGSMLICDITAQAVKEYQQSRLDAGAGAATINKEVTCLASILRNCGIWHMIKKSKNDVRQLEEPESRGRALDLKQEKALLAAAAGIGAGKHRQGHWSPVYVVTVLGLNTGMRHCEIRSLHWSQIDLSTRVLIVGKTKTAAGTGRCVPLNQPTWAALDGWAARFPDRQPEHFVFPACENGQVNPATSISHWRTAWTRACEKAGLPGLGFHSLRHSAVTKLLENGVPFAIVAQIMGWAPSTAIRMAKRYGHIRPEVQRAALEKIATPTIPIPQRRRTKTHRGSYKTGYSREGVVRSASPNSLTVQR